MSAEKPNKFYLTTPIYYVNARPHIGHAYTTIVADVLARRHRLLGDDTFFLTGTDEHGQKIARSAAAAGIPPQQFADQVSQSFQNLWARMGITNDAFIRTTAPRHIQGAQKLFSELYARGQIYLSSYTGQYSIGEEMFVDGPPGTLGPDGRPTETVTEENFFFRLSDYQLPLLNLIESNQLLITPDSARNEVLSFLRGNLSAVPSSNLSSRPESSQSLREDGVERPPVEAATIAHTTLGNPYVPGTLRDLSVSRSSFTWGIPVPDDILRAAGTTQKHVIYVWLDALSNYMTAIGYGSDAPADQASFQRYWPADLHLVGKEITRFHCVYWPAFLLALNPALLHSAQTVSPNDAVLLSEASQPHREAESKDHRISPVPPQLSMAQHQAWAAQMLPKQITAHGWLLFDNSKMSKSKGNIVRTETILDSFGALCPPQRTPALKGTGFSPSVTETPTKDAALAAEVHPPTQHDRDLFAADVLRYFLLREIPFGQDGSFSFDALITRYNADLANGYGNLVSRTLTLVQKGLRSEFQRPYDHGFASGTIGEGEEDPIGKPFDWTLGVRGEPWWANEPWDRSPTLEQAVANHFGNARYGLAIEAIWEAIRSVDTFLSDNTPWKLIGTTIGTSESVALKPLDKILYTAAESIRIITALLYPILPYATARVWSQLGLGDIEQAARNGKLTNLQWGGLQPGTKLGPLAPIFPRADKGLAQIMIDMENDRTSTPLTTEDGQRTKDTSHPAAGPRTAPLDDPSGTLPVAGSAALTTGPHATPSHAEAPASGIFANQPGNAAPPAANTADAIPQIAIDDFAKIDLRVAQILVAERIPKADKLLRLEVDLGPELGRRQILSGIAEFYAPEDLIGRRIVVIANLAPRKMRGLESHGMLLAASADDPANPGKPGKPVLATMAEDIALGSRLK